VRKIVDQYKKDCALCAEALSTILAVYVQGKRALSSNCLDRPGYGDEYPDIVRQNGSDCDARRLKSVAAIQDGRTRAAG
jgi:hypothetical protein